MPERLTNLADAWRAGRQKGDTRSSVASVAAGAERDPVGARPGANPEYQSEGRVMAGSNSVTAQPLSANELAAERTDLAVERSVMAAGRTLMAWVRTALSMISFGFTIYKFMQAATQHASAEVGLLSAQGPRRLGLFLIALGVISVVLGSIEYYQTVQRLNTLSATKYRALNFSFIVGMLIGLLGLFLFITILTHTEVF